MLKLIALRRDNHSWGLVHYNDVIQASLAVKSPETRLLFWLVTKKISKCGSYWHFVSGIHHFQMPLTKGQKWRKLFHVITSSCRAHTDNSCVCPGSHIRYQLVLINYEWRYILTISLTSISRAEMSKRYICVASRGTTQSKYSRFPI